MKNKQFLILFLTTGILTSVSAATQSVPLDNVLLCSGWQSGVNANPSNLRYTEKNVPKEYKNLYLKDKVYTPVSSEFLQKFRLVKKIESEGGDSVDQFIYKPKETSTQKQISINDYDKYGYEIQITRTEDIQILKNRIEKQFGIKLQSLNKSQLEKMHAQDKNIPIRYLFDSDDRPIFPQQAFYIKKVKMVESLYQRNYLTLTSSLSNKDDVILTCGFAVE